MEGREVRHVYAVSAFNLTFVNICHFAYIDVCTLLTNLDPGQNASSQFGSIALSGLFGLRDNMEIQQKSFSFDIYLAQQRRFVKNKESQFNNS